MASGLRWIDCNARIGRWSAPQPEQFTEIDGLLAAWERVGIEGGLAHHAWAWEWSPDRGNTALTDEIEAHETIHPCFVALPHATREMEPVLQFARGVRAAGGAVRIFPKKHAWSVQDWCAGALLDALQTAQVPLLVDLPQVGWEAVAGILQAHPRLPVIVLESYYRIDRNLYPLLERHRNLYLEANTYGVFMGVEAIVERFGAERLVFGTGLPNLEAGGPMALVAYADISDEDRAKIAGGNLLRLLGQPWGESDE
jgi:hypothetical protein